MTLAQTAKIVVPSDMLNWDHGLFDQEGRGPLEGAWLLFLFLQLRVV